MLNYILPNIQFGLIYYFEMALNITDTVQFSYKTRHVILALYQEHKVPQ